MNNQYKQEHSTSYTQTSQYFVSGRHPHVPVCIRCFDIRNVPDPRPIWGESTSHHIYLASITEHTYWDQSIWCSDLQGVENINKALIDSSHTHPIFIITSHLIFWDKFFWDKILLNLVTTGGGRLASEPQGSRHSHRGYRSMPPWSLFVWLLGSEPRSSNLHSTRFSHWIISPALCFFQEAAERAATAGTFLLSAGHI